MNNDVSLVLDEPKIEDSIQSEFQFYYKDSLRLKGNKIYHVNFVQHYTAIKITEKSYNQTTIHLNTESDSLYFGTLFLEGDIDIPPGFAVFRQPTNSINIKANKNTELLIELFYAPQIDVFSPKIKTKKDDCEKPETIAQSVWRAGLPDPIPGRNSVIVKHCIVHHSAGSNTDTNYINTVRNIYLLHTQSNGWDDIGYNFVIAPNGDVFSGRDPRGVADEDNIEGAHFCGKNGETMGVCLLGNYNLISPKQEMIDALESLLVWKLNKEKLSALASYPHPTPTSPDLGTIAMHQNGCATECPGDSVRFIIDDIKEEVEDKLKLCNGFTSILNENRSFKKVIYPNPSSGKFYALIEKEAEITSYRILALDGKEVANGRYLETGYINVKLPTGTYILELWNENSPVIKHRISIQSD